MTLPLSIVPTIGSQRPRSLAEALIASQETTGLAPLDESAFRRWAEQRGIGDVDDPESHYDYRGAYQAGVSRAGNGHFTDQFKQHGHPTFSVESQYSRGAGDGGTWDGETFHPAAPDPARPPDPGGLDLPTIRDLNRRELAPMDYGLGRVPRLVDLLGGITVPEALQSHSDRMRQFYGRGRIPAQLGGNGAPYPRSMAPMPSPLGSPHGDGAPQAAQGARALARLIRPSPADVTAALPHSPQAPPHEPQPAPRPQAAVVHPVDRAIEEAMREEAEERRPPQPHAVDRAMALALEDHPHHSHRQPRDDVGQFAGPPAPTESDGITGRNDLALPPVGEIE